MTTFFAKLPAGHPIRSKSGPQLLAELSANPMVMEVVPGGEYGMGSRKYTPPNRWKRARKGLLHKELWDSAGNPESTGCFGTI